MRPLHPALYWQVFVLLCLAVARATRFIVTDSFPPIRALRERIGKKYHFGGELISSEWSVGLPIAFAAVGILIQLISLPLPWLWALGVSFVGSWLAVRTDH